MSWLFSRALVEAFSAGTYSDGEPSAQLNVMPTAQPFWHRDKTMEPSRLSRFGPTCAVLTDARGETVLTSYLEAFPVKTYRAQTALGSELMGRDQDCGPSSRESLAKFDPNSHSWKTAQRSLFGGLAEFSEIWPRWGSMRDGECFPLAPLVPHTHGSECSYWPTPRASDRDNCGGSNARRKAQERGVYVGRDQNPQLQEWLMGWPIDWTDCAPAGMDKFQQWQQQHGAFLADPEERIAA